MRKFMAILTAFLLAVPPATAAGLSSKGTVEGTVTLDGRPLSVELALVDMSSGAIQKVVSDSAGHFRAQIAPGRYVFASQGHAGLGIGRAPAVLPIEAGRVASAQVELIALPVLAQAAEGATGGTTVNHEAIGCLIAGQFPMLDSDIQPAAEVARARLYFKSVSSEYFYSEMQVVQLPDGRSAYRGWMPKPTLAASPITYYISATTTKFGENRTPEYEAVVVDKEEDCKDKKVAAIGQAPAGLTFFSASTGAVAVPAGFAAGGLAIGAGTVAIIAIVGAGAAAAGIAAANNDASPSPAASASPAAPPPASPSPAPRPSPSAPPCICPDSQLPDPATGICGCQLLETPCAPPSPAICAP